jgi:hypothetical protein
MPRWSPPSAALYRVPLEPDELQSCWMPTVRELIEQAGSTAKESVETAKARYLDQVRGILRDLTRLKFTDRQGVESQHTSIPIRVVPGLPQPLESMAIEHLPSGEQWGIETIGFVGSGY